MTSEAAVQEIKERKATLDTANALKDSLGKDPRNVKKTSLAEFTKLLARIRQRVAEMHVAAYSFLDSASAADAEEQLSAIIKGGMPR